MTSTLTIKTEGDLKRACPITDTESQQLLGYGEDIEWLDERESSLWEREGGREGGGGGGGLG